MYAAAEPLVASDNPSDWDAAEKYLEPLALKYPDRYKDEVTEARRSVKDRRELRRAIAECAKPDLRSDAERGYLRGLRFAQDGDSAQAKLAWEGVVSAFGAVESEERWVKLARAGLKLLAQPPEASGGRKPPVKP